MKHFLFPLALLFLFYNANGETNFFQPSPRPARPAEVIYFLLPDRFWNGDQSNDFGGLATGAAKINGFDPMDANFFHGGDLKGVADKLSYLQELGVTSIWMTPIFKNRVVQDYGNGNVHAGYHGYWGIDFTDVDPHFGSKEDLKQLISEGKKRGIGTILDIVVNHTADIIRPKNGVYEYQYKFSKPYTDASGKVFDDRDFIGSPAFPQLDGEKSFPVPPSFASEADRTIKKPDWLNDPTVYHNRGNASTGGESAQYGDVSGLDDLFTEQPRVVQGMIDIYANWIREFDIAGFRIDTVKHVNNEFWTSFVPAMLQEAKKAERKDFLIFGEVYDPDPGFLSEFAHRAAMPSVLDFGFQHYAPEFAAGKVGPDKIATVFAKDSYYITPTTNAYSLVTFLGNHDVGRIGYFLQRDAANASELVERDILAHALMFFTRGIPSVYYGDEQGFMGKGGDAAARQDMFASLVPEYMQEQRIGGGIGPAFDQKSPLYSAIKELVSIRKNNETLQTGIQIVRYADEQPGLLAISRINPRQREEMLVLFNNANEPKRADIPVSSAAGNWERVYSSGAKGINFGPGPDNRITVELAARSTLVLRNPQPIEARGGQLGELSVEAKRTSELDDRWQIKATLDTDQIISVAFGVRAKGETDYKYLGTADAPPFQVFPTRAAMPKGEELEFKAIGRDLFGNEKSAETTQLARPAKRKK
jgi:glycosidase